MAAMIGNDILDIGTRKARRQRGDPLMPPALTLGAPGQFDLPNVADVRFMQMIYLLVMDRKKTKGANIILRSLSLLSAGYVLP